MMKSASFDVASNHIIVHSYLWRVKIDAYFDTYYLVGLTIHLSWSIMNDTNFYFFSLKIEHLLHINSTMVE